MVQNYENMSVFQFFCLKVKILRRFLKILRVHASVCPCFLETLGTRGGQKNYNNDDNDDDDDYNDDNDNDDDNDYNVFSLFQRTSNRVGTRGGGQ